MKKTISLHLGAFLSVFLGTLIALVALTLVAETVIAHDEGWEWEYPETTPVVENRTNDYGSDVYDAANAYDNYTDLGVDTCPSDSECGNLIHLQGNYGDTGWDARAKPYSHGTDCYDNPGYCNHTDRRVDFGYVYFNDYEGTYEPIGYGTRHEMGHIFGLSHIACSQENSVMRHGGCRPDVPTTLTSHDVGDINGYY